MNKMSIAVIGDQDTVNGLRLAGVGLFKSIIEGDRDISEDVRKALKGFITRSEIGIVTIQEDYLKYVEDMIEDLRQRGKITPVIIGIPSKNTPPDQDVTEHYKTYIREFIGFDVKL
jgi:vacuolar-type H+-ATPase subunit F/Vma7